MINILYAFILLLGSICICANEHNLKIEDCSKLSESELEKEYISAIKLSDTYKMERLIEAGVNLNIKIHHDFDPYCEYGHSVDHSPIDYAIQRGLPSVLKVLLRFEEDLNPFLDSAVWSDQWECAFTLLEKGAEINHVNCYGNTPLSIAIENGYSSLAEKLIERGADINAQIGEGETPLILSIRKDNKRLIQILLEADVDVTKASKNGNTPLIEAIRQIDDQMVQTLLNIPQMTTPSYFGFGPMPLNHRDSDGNTALMIAIKGVRTRYRSDSNREYNECIDSQNIVQSICKIPGVDFFIKNNEGQCAMDLMEKYL